MVLYMNKDGERKSAFVAAIEKEKDGAEGQVQCMEEAILSLIPKRIRSTVTNVWEWIAEGLKPKKAIENVNDIIAQQNFEDPMVDFDHMPIDFDE